MNQPNRQVIRLTTSCWSDQRGLHVRRSLATLRRKSCGHQILDEESSAVGAAETLAAIKNLHEYKDGVYVVATCNESKDWETGYLDAYDLKLLPWDDSDPQTRA